ncbi:hypothetical protein AALB_1454 [Agarivorans albus MKT 106]|uniref:Uncharacterized protein n=1 Tax=Agarivorans albus MKT 106 TaxID=1331007 RepID=R9PJ24_AGAAL|nr:hypothetical protein AALB_1454 [Agarivorans albus MKT 106]
MVSAASKLATQIIGLNKLDAQFISMFLLGVCRDDAQV